MGGRSSSFRHKSGGSLASIKNIELQGSKKQIAWAKDIRNAVIKDYEDFDKIKSQFDNLYNSKNADSAKEREAIIKMEKIISKRQRTVELYGDYRSLKMHLEGKIKGGSGKRMSIDELKKKSLRRYDSDVDKKHVSDYYDTIARQYKRAGGDKARKACINYYSNKSSKTRAEYTRQSNRAWYDFVKIRWGDRLKNNDAEWWIEHR